MSFNSVGFLIFLPVTLIVHYILPHKFRWVWLLLASYFFYMTWKPEMAVLIFSVTLVAYVGGLVSQYLREVKNSRKGSVAAAAAACAVSLGLLIFFKYFGFILNNINTIAAGFGHTISVPDIILPVGISFYTFQAVGYVIDVAKGKYAAEKHFGYFALFVSFFPQLVAGPIEKAETLIPQLKKEKKPDKENIYAGLAMILVGFFKKIAVADILAGPVDTIFKNPQAAGSGFTLVGVFLFAVQIFCDFSGYTDIAKGAAQLLGIELSKNFDKPYAAVSVGDFWRRWHITLSSWLREYVYFPLGGSRKGEFRTCLNYVIVFLVSGLWHGAAWHFVIWGLLHGLFIVAERLTLPVRNRFWEKLKVRPDGKAVTAIRRIVTFGVVCFLWIFFRAGSMTEAWNVISTIFSFKAQTASGIFGGISYVFAAAAGILVLILVDGGRAGLSVPGMTGIKDLQKAKVSKVIMPAAAVVMIWAIVWAWLMLSSSSAASAFIYFQF
ncbi:MAG: MBOAT family protein [Clostridia bacterium]|nr:MBOAT family protein [Clostridia bacterium]